MSNDCKGKKCIFRTMAIMTAPPQYKFEDEVELCPGGECAQYDPFNKKCGLTR